jgi:hypothetical protein
MRLPQPPQNLAPGSFSKPQARQGECSGAPHWAQKRLVATFSSIQLGQRIRCFSAARNNPVKHNREVIAMEVERQTRPSQRFPRLHHDPSALMG